MEESRNGQMRTKRKVSHICLLMLALLQLTAPSLAQDDTDTNDTDTNDTDTISTTSSSISTISTNITSTNTTSITTATTTLSALRYSTRPADLTVAVGGLAVFSCGVPVASPNFTFTLFGSHGNFILTCPFGHEENIPQALYGSCGMKNRESLGVWVLKGTSFSDNGTRAVCQQLKNPKASVAFLHVYDNGVSYATLIGCAIGGFFGILLVFGLAYTMLQRSETLQRFFRGSVSDDMTTIITKE